MIVGLNNRDIMKKTLFICLAIIAGISANAQDYYQDVKNPAKLNHHYGKTQSRKELFLPQVNGYNVYKADLHTHTMFSDGQVLPSYRVQEAWMDGLDVMAVTEHIEHRPHEATFVDYLERYTAEDRKEAKNHRGIGYKPLDKDGIMVDLNYSYKLAKQEAAKFGLTIIQGSEITRSGTKIGHFNALFTTDNNLLFDLKPVEAMRKAKAQGALIMHNHPGWSRTNVDYTKVELEAYEAGLIDGVEVVNGGEFYPDIIDRVRERGLFIAASTDIHGTTSSDYRMYGYRRPMTLILAPDKSLESLKEALQARRTIAFAFNTLSGSKELLEAFFRASVKCECLKGKTYVLTNTTDIPYIIQQENANPIILDSESSVRIAMPKEAKTLKITVNNMWIGAKENLTVELK